MSITPSIRSWVSATDAIKDAAGATSELTGSAQPSATVTTDDSNKVPTLDHQVPPSKHPWRAPPDSERPPPWVAHVAAASDRITERKKAAAAAEGSSGSAPATAWPERSYEEEQEDHLNELKWRRIWSQKGL